MGKLPDLKHAIFDVGGVLYKLDYDRMWRNFQRASKKPVEKIKNALHGQQSLIKLERGKISSLEYYKAVIKDLECSLSFGEFEKFFNSFLIKHDEIFDLLSELKKCISINFLSNTNEINIKVFNEELEKIAESITYSCRTGYMKPEPMIFRIALDRAGAAPEETIFIDDSEENVRVAKTLGLRSHLFESKIGLLKFLKGEGIHLT